MRVATLMSGGIDSTITLASALDAGHACCSLYVDLGSRASPREYESACRVCEHYGVPLTRMRCHCPWWQQHSMFDPRKVVYFTAAKRKANPMARKPRIVGFRNFLMLSAGIAFADEMQCEQLWVGFDYCAMRGSSRDKSPAFVRAFQTAIDEGKEPYQRIRLFAPILHLNKRDIFRLGRKLKVPYELTYSCYTGLVDACGFCPACVIRANAFPRYLRMRDPAGFAAKKALYDAFGKSDANRYIQASGTAAFLRSPVR